LTGLGQSSDPEEAGNALEDVGRRFKTASGRGT